MPFVAETKKVTCLKTNRSRFFSLTLEFTELKVFMLWRIELPPTIRRFTVTKNMEQVWLWGCIISDCIAPSLYILFNTAKVNLFTSILERCVNPFKEWFLIRLMKCLELNFISIKLYNYGTNTQEWNWTTDTRIFSPLLYHWATWTKIHFTGVEPVTSSLEGYCSIHWAKNVIK